MCNPQDIFYFAIPTSVMSPSLRYFHIYICTMKCGLGPLPHHSTTSGKVVSHKSGIKMSKYLRDGTGFALKTAATKWEWLLTHYNEEWLKVEQQEVKYVYTWTSMNWFSHFFLSVIALPQRQAFCLWDGTLGLKKSERVWLWVTWLDHCEALDWPWKYYL